MDNHPGRIGGGLGTSLPGMNNPILFCKRCPEQIMLRHLLIPSMRLKPQSIMVLQRCLRSGTVIDSVSIQS